MRLLPALFFTASVLTALPVFGQSDDDHFVEKLLDKYQLPSISLAVVEGDAISYEAAKGVKSLESGEAVDENTIYAAASLSKPMFAYAVMQLAEEGALDLDRPVHEYFQYADVAHDPLHTRVTARMLLSHSSGLPNWRSGELEFVFEPGTDYRYSGEGYVWLMRAMEHLTGQPINDLVQARVFGPLGMPHSSYVWRSAFDNYALPHNPLDEVVAKPKPESGNSAHSLQTTARDFAQLLIALFNQKGLSAESIEALSRPQVEVRSFFGEDPVEPGGISWGLGWGIQQTSRGKALWQWGDNGPFKAFVIAYPERKKGLVYFVNHSNGLRLVPELVRHFLDDTCPAFARLDYSMEDPPALLLGKAILGSGYDLAIADLQAEGNAFPDTTRFSAGDIHELATHLWQRGRLEDVDKLYGHSLPAYPDAAPLAAQAFLFYLNQNEVEKARQYYEQALSLDPGLFPVANLLLPWRNRVEEANVRLTLEGHEDALQVMLAGAFNDWNPESLPMIRSKAGWVAALKLPPGAYGYKFVVDGAWILDPAQDKTTEEGGYTNSLLEVK